MKKIDTYYTAISQIARKDGSHTSARYETLKEAILNCKANTFNVYTIYRVSVYETLFGNFKRMHAELTQA